MTKFIKSARAYADKLGWAVFPCHSIDPAGICSCGDTECSSPGKHPRTQNGVLDATTDPDQIKKWWEQWPTANVAIATGKISGIDVLDIDPRHGGNQSLEELEAQHEPIPSTPIANTGGGGRHIVFRHHEGLRNKAGIAPGIDIRADGGYVVAAPSIHASGNIYSWDANLKPTKVDIAEWPPWLLALAQGPADGKTPAAPPVDGEIPEGQRNAILLSLAGTMHRRGMVEAEIAAALHVINETRCSPPDQRQLFFPSATIKIPGLGLLAT